MIKIDLKQDKKLILLCLIVICVGIIKYFIPALNPLQYAFLILHVFIILSAKEEEFIPIVLFNHTCSALYDDVSFQYIFNLTIVIFVLKIILSKNIKLNKTLFFFFVVLVLYELILNFVNIGISSQLLNLVTFFSSYLFVILIISSKNKVFINLELIYKYFFWGFIASAIAGYMYPISNWGITNVPVAYRFKGLLRDSNYYSVDALLLIISSMLYKKRVTKEAIIIFLVGLLAVSKMFIAVSLLAFFIALFNQIIKVRSKKQMISLLVLLLCIPIVFYFASKTDFINDILNKYLYRTDSVSLFTGREYIQKYYMDTLAQDPITLLFGRSTSYASVLNIGHDIENPFYYNIVAHNTYLDMILSWGIFGMIFYIVNIYQMFSIFKKNFCPGGKYTLWFIFFIGLCLFALSYLMLDFFAILILYIIIFSLSKKEEKSL